MEITRGLIIADPWIEYILDGSKIWEMRSTATSHRGWFGLIRRGSGQIHGIARLVDCGKPLTPDEMLATIQHHCIPTGMIRSGKIDKWVVPWQLADVRRLPVPVDYQHRSGAVTWVNFDQAVCDTLTGIIRGLPVRDRPKAALDHTPAKLSATVATTAIPEKQTGYKRPAKGPLSSLRIDADHVIGRTQLTGGNLRNNHFYLTPMLDKFPADAIGGPNKASRAPKDLIIHWGGPAPVRCDIDKKKKLFRSRGWVGDFLQASGAQEGDWVVVHGVAPYEIRVTLEKAVN